MQSELTAAAAPDDSAQIKKLMIYFAMVYVVEGVGQINGVMQQPVSFYLKEVHGWTAVQVTAFLTVFNFPWIIKPVYGIVSDFVPLFGYRRRSYLILANVLASVAFFSVTLTQAPSQLLFVLLLTAYAMAISSTLCGALLVENGQRFRMSGAFVNQQWLWYNIAAMTALLISGQLVQYLSPTSALHGAALIGATAPLMVVFGTWFLVAEEKRPVNLPELKAGFRALLASFKTRTLWIVGSYLFLFYFSPGFTTPLFYYMTDTLKFPQGYIGILGAIQSAGAIIAGLVYRRYLTGMSSKRLLQLSIAIGALSNASFLLLYGEVSAAILHFGYGVATMIALVAALTLAADYCPKRSEGFAFAALMSVSNLATTLADNFGAYLYDQVFDSRIGPLVLVSGAFTAFAFVLIPLLRLGDKPQGHAAGD